MKFSFHQKSRKHTYLQNPTCIYEVDRPKETHIDTRLVNRPILGLVMR